MGQLAEYLQEESARLKAEFPDRERAAEEWQLALDSVFDQIVSWLNESDPSGRLRILRDRVPHYELRLGHGDLPRLTVVYEASEVVFQPKPRYSHVLSVLDAAGKSRRADGFVSVLCPEPSGHHLFRLLDGDQSRWFLMSSYPGQKHKPEYVPLTRDALEGLLVGLLK